MIDRALFIDAVRAYIGTPFQHQGRRRGDGIDCAGLLTCAAYDVGLTDVRVTDYTPQPDPLRFREIAREHMDAVAFADLTPGDVLTFAFKDAEQHFGVVVSMNPKRFVHAYASVGKCVDQELTLAWLRRVRGCYRIRGLAPWQS